MKGKTEDSAQKLVEAAQAYNNLFEKFNKLKSDSDDKGNEIIHLKKRLEELEVAQSAQEAELKEAKIKADYYEDKSMSIKCQDPPLWDPTDVKLNHLNLIKIRKI